MVLPVSLLKNLNIFFRNSKEVILPQVHKRVIAGFEKLINTGIERGILWSDIDNLWSGYFASLQGDFIRSVFHLSLPSRGLDT